MSEVKKEVPNIISTFSDDEVTRLCVGINSFSLLLDNGLRILSTINTDKNIDPNLKLAIENWIKGYHETAALMDICSNKHSIH